MNLGRIGRLRALDADAAGATHRLGASQGVQHVAEVAPDMHVCVTTAAVLADGGGTTFPIPAVSLVYFTDGRAGFKVFSAPSAADAVATLQAGLASASTANLAVAGRSAATGGARGVVSCTRRSIIPTAIIVIHRAGIAPAARAVA